MAAPARCGRLRRLTGSLAARALVLFAAATLLPLVDGLEVLRRVKGDPRTRRLPVVVLTSSRQDPDIQAAYDLGANGYIVKPGDFDLFSEAMQVAGVDWLLHNQSPRE